jgi:hypothetical protein
LVIEARLTQEIEEATMTAPALSDRMFQRIMRELVNTGRAPHYAELGRDLGLDVEAARQLLHEVMRAYPIGWLHPETDYIASFPPLNSLPGIVGHLNYGFGPSRGRPPFL